MNLRASFFGETGEKLVPLTRKVFASNMFVLLLQTLVVESSRGLFIPSIAHSNKAIGGTTFTLGVLIAIKSVGRFVASPMMGWWSEKGNDQGCLYISCLLSAIGGTLFVSGMLGGHLWMLMAARFIAGLGGGVLGPIRAHIAKITTVQQRVTYMGMCAAAQYAGFAMMPVVGVWFKGITFSNELVVNSDTMPAWILIALNLTMPVLVYFFFENNVTPAAQAAAKLTRTQSGTAMYRSSPKEVRPNIGGIAIDTPVAVYRGLSWQRIVDMGIVMYMMFNFVSRGVISVVETTGALQFQALYNVEDFEFIEESSIFFSKVGLGGFAMFCLTMWFSKRNVKEEILLFLAFVCIGVGSLMLTLSEPMKSKTMFNVGFVLVWSIGFPVKQTCLLSSFSKILGAKPQGMLMGWISTAGSFGRIVFPVLVGFIGVAVIGWINVGNCFLMAILLLCYITVVGNFKKWAVTTPLPSSQNIVATYGSISQ